MSKRLVVSSLLIVALGLMNLPVSQDQSPQIKTSVYQDDPFLAESYIGRVDASTCSFDSNRHPVMSGARVSMINESKIYKKDANAEFVPFAWNPWPQEGTSNE